MSLFFVDRLPRPDSQNNTCKLDAKTDEDGKGAERLNELKKNHHIRVELLQSVEKRKLATLVAPSLVGVMQPALEG